MLIKESNISPQKAKEFIEYISSLDSNRYVYAETIRDKFLIDKKESLLLLSILKRENILNNVFKFYCPICQYVDDTIYDDFGDIIGLEYKECTNCSHVLHSIESKNLDENVIYFFKTK